MAFNPITKVTVTRLGGKFRYIAHREDGTETIIRTATREYRNAFQHERQACTGPRGLSAFFTFGQKPGSKIPLVASFQVTEG